MRRAGFALSLTAALAACGDDASPLDPATSREVVHAPATPRAQLDLLLQIDDSIGGVEMQSHLRASLPSLFTRLATVDGALPDLHVGVISGDLGASSVEFPQGGTDISGSTCTGAGRAGLLQPGQATLDGAFLVDEAAGADRTRNYAGELAATVGQMIALGGAGCGFEQPLRAVRTALAPGANGAFLRPDAALAVVILTDEDDCSALDDELFDPSDATFGPRDSYRCTRHGLTCDEALDTAGPKTNCRAREDSPMIEGIGPTRDFLAALKPDPSQVVVAAITAPATSVVTALRPAPSGGAPVLGLENACEFGVATARSFAAPAVRIAELVGDFASRGVQTSLCETSLDAQLGAIALAANRALGTLCIDDTGLADADPAAPGVQPTCAVHDVPPPARAPRSPRAPPPPPSTATSSSPIPPRARRSPRTCGSRSRAPPRPPRARRSRRAARPRRSATCSRRLRRRPRRPRRRRAPAAARAAAAARARYRRDTP